MLAYAEKAEDDKVKLVKQKNPSILETLHGS